jgi:MFS superfamily sulfate permease-like transporter
LLSNLPNVVLAAIVLVAVKGLIDIAELRHVWRVSRFDFSVSMVAFAAVLLLGILKGVMVAVVVSLLLLIRRAANPHVAFLGRIPGTRRYSDMERNPDNEAVPGALVFRVEASLLYFNVEHVRDAVWEKIRSITGPLKLVVCDLSASPLVDLAGARMLVTLHAALQAVGVSLRLVAAHAAVRDLLRAEELEERVGYFGRRVSEADVIDEFLGDTGPAGAAATPTSASA